MNIAKNRKLMDFKKLLKKEIKPNAKVLVVGPNNLQEDPSTYFINNLVKKGKLEILDVAHATYGWGGTSRFKEGWKSATRKSMPRIIETKIGKNIPIKAKTVDVVYDHNSLLFVAGGPEKIKKNPEIINKILGDYLRVLRPGGKIIFAAPKEVQGFLDLYGGTIVRNILRGRESPYKLKIRFVKTAKEDTKYTAKGSPFYPAERVIVIEKPKKVQK